MQQQLKQHNVILTCILLCVCKRTTGQLEYKGKGNFVIQRKNAETGKVGPVESNVTHIGMIAGGTGKIQYIILLYFYRFQYLSN